LNIFMTAMCNIIEAENGIVDKFIGDGIMAIFTTDSAQDSAQGGAQEGADHHAVAAVRAGIRMQQKLEAMRLSDPTIRHLQMRIGINTGEVVAGNIGSETRMDYTVIGDNVNVASRIESACRPDGVLVSESTWAMVKTHNTFIGEAQAPLYVKNRDQSVATYLVMPRTALTVEIGI
jgi:adenylate cyclase